ncbi:uncharacterized protein EDB91DRAFT_1247065 [Suillus paluster]|uniref:uncharacterized protein n=1 Tax=Suillus paluster TaxID=48578 RepID=UPI001B868F4F|nr:uncharacterized protein EDB91DRAFT_1247065 [Suillus paluster]KAG1743567.1 hypothetical protein EDB91DRAFT_1247065 [Suillus paluster]
MSPSTLCLPTAPSISYLYMADDFDANGNFISTGVFSGDSFDPVNSTGSEQVPNIDQIDWDDLSLYIMPLTNNEIAALTKDIAATNIPTIPELPTPPARTPLPQPSPTEAEVPDTTPSSQSNPTEAEVLDTIVEIPESLHEANTSYWAARNPTRAIICPWTPPPRLTDAQKASQKIKRGQKIERTKHLHDTVAEYLNAQKMKIKALSRAHHVTPKHINDIIGSQTHY